MNIIDEIRERAIAAPNHSALVIDGRSKQSSQTISYAELVRRMDKFADKLRKAGCQSGQRVGLIAPQGVGFIEAGLGIMAAGLCFVPISDDYKDTALEDFIKRTRINYLLLESEGFNVRRFPDSGDVDGQNDNAFRALEPAYIRFTSGTTNERKGVVIGHRSILDRLANANQALNISAEDKIMWMLPMAHHFVVSILLYLRYGATILMPAGNLSEQVLRFANDQGATVFYASPYHYGLLAKDVTELGLSNLRLAVSTASGLSEDVAEKFYQRMGIPLTQALGVIEVGLPVINLARAKEKPMSLGQVLPAYDVWLRGEDGKPVTGNNGDDFGEICIRGTGTFDAYMAPWLLAEEILGADGFCTGDIGYFDSDGDLVIQGRQHNRINMAGMKFFVEEVEAVLNRHPSVKESRVYGKPHAHVGEIPMAEIVLNESAEEVSQQTLAEFCHLALAAHKIPFEFELVESLAYTVTGKIKRW